MAHFKHQQVRVRYAFCCGYCGISETDAGGELTIDHFHPQSRGGDDSDDNLVYACYRCNQYKGAFVPSAAQQAQSLRLLHPLRDELTEHITGDVDTGRLEGRTPTGTFHIHTLNLNRAELMAHRLRRWVAAQVLSELDQSLAENAEDLAVFERQQGYIRILREQLGQTQQPGDERG